MRLIFVAGGVAILAFIVAGVILLRLKGPAMLSSFFPTPSPDEMYPAAPPMPPVVAVPVEDLLATYEERLQANAPSVFAALQPGLDDSAIDQLEAAHAFKLTGDLRALYRWRNGTRRGANLNAFPNHDFLPLEVALATRDALRGEVSAATAEQRQAYAAFAGHRTPWLGLIQDHAGDGYFFDPARSESEGSFFFSFNEDGSYVFYPAFRNYLAAVIEGEKDGAFVAGTQGIETADFFKAQALWQRFGAASFPQ